MENIQGSEFENKQSQIDEWVKTLSEKCVLNPIDRGVLREVLEGHGAEFGHLKEEEEASLASYKNADRALALRAIWGDRFDEFKDWSRAWGKDWEERNGLVLPTIKQRSKKEPDKILVYKNSGMIQLFGTWNGLAGLGEEKYPFGEAKRLIEARARNGRLWVEGEKSRREKVSIPSSTKPKFLSSFPPDFPVDAWNFIKTW